MKKHIERLHQIANGESRRIIGLMSGTSLDGLDIALCHIEKSGTETGLTLEKFTTIPYEDQFRDQIRTIFAKRQIDFQQLCLLNPYIGLVHGKMIKETLANWNIAPSDIDLIASHGQTVFHAPQKQHHLPDFPNATLQIGDGDHIAVETGIITISDFRQKHIAAGGEGAPLAVYGDYFLFSKKDENRILLNMGGIANFTYLPGHLDAAAVFTTDTGPGNTLLDYFTRKLFNKPFDENGAIAASGTVNELLLNALKFLPFFSLPFPKTTGPEVFNFEYVETAIQKTGLSSLSNTDLIATLTQLSADTISDAILRTIESEQEYRIYASGGGAHNPVLMQAISQNLNQDVGLIDELGVSGDAKEAVLFAVLANETVAGMQSDFGKKEGVPSISMGKISFPG
ncbi:Anhydro-N-acetylmuramic acid kinase [Dyadobacter sp. CECT 9623]|uniref:Anhydro-N-acetylmuramic acid kinase n=1 Tax=Dyadobacter linearis TaxID=2823330 RepID=A0ABM8UXK6_9BACT|nr:anhydro-N-acetylmuramic acid kinase [Dyadobacter sp. CECT 9623]CAG5074261.1 Anhydro-N-acetylmuramic acid kinase [Dyadobacter sp. CECT 9623]